MDSGTITNALTIDFEDWYHGIEIPQSRWGDLEDRLDRPARRLLEMLAAAGTRATFFVLGRVAERHAGLVREIAAAGHEIATHGWSHTPIYRQSPEQFRAELARSIRLLEAVGDQPVLGHRAPYFSITRDSLWALEILCELGIRYDSSIFPVHNYRYGISSAPRWPNDIVAGARTIRQFPLTTWRVLGLNVPVAGGAYFRVFPYSLTRHALRAINRAGHPATFYLHPWELDPAHPRIALPPRIAITHYANLGATERRFERLLADFRFAPMKDVLGIA